MKRDKCMFCQYKCQTSTVCVALYESDSARVGFLTARKVFLMGQCQKRVYDRFLMSEIVRNCKYPISLLDLCMLFLIKMTARVCYYVRGKQNVRDKVGPLEDSAEI